MNNHTQSSGNRTSRNRPLVTFDGSRFEEVRNNITEGLRCIKCSGRENVVVKSFTKTYYPPIAYLALPFAVFIGVLLFLLLRVQHRLKLPFCIACWKKIKRAYAFEVLSVMAFFATIILGVVLLLNFDSWLAFLAFPVAPVGLIVWAQINKWNVSVKYKKVNRTKVIVSGPTSDIVFAR